MNPRRKNDILLKSVIEEFFADMLRFFTSKADNIFDLDRGITFLDKELLEIIPETETAGGSRFMDMLAKVWLQSGEEEWLLVHIEVQRQHDPNFASRMFTYYYRTLDRFNVPITAFAIFTGAKGQSKPNLYERNFMGTKLTYQYNALQIFDYSEANLLKMNNPFALVILAAQKLVLSGKLSDQELNGQRLAIAKALIDSRKYDHEKIQRFLSFLKNFIYIQNEEINNNFDSEIHYLTGNKTNMDIIEALKYISKEEGREEGREEGIEQKTEKVIINLIQDLGLNDEQAARIADSSISFVKEVRKKLN